MKNTLKTVVLLMLALALCLSLAACGSENKEETAEAQTVDFSQYPEKFEDWTLANLKSYLRECGVIVKDDWTIDVTSGDLDAIGADSGVMYIDMNGGTIMDMIFFFDAQSEGTEDMLNTLRETRAITPNVEGAPTTPMDAMLGTFCFSYTMGADAEHNALLVKAIRDLADHYGIEPDFITD